MKLFFSPHPFDRPWGALVYPRILSKTADSFSGKNLLPKDMVFFLEFFCSRTVTTRCRMTFAPKTMLIRTKSWEGSTNKFFWFHAKWASCISGILKIPIFLKHKYLGQYWSDWEKNYFTFHLGTLTTIYLGQIRRFWKPIKFRKQKISSCSSTITILFCMKI